MTTNSFSKYPCWQQTRISEVINKDAIAIDRATFLATHTPFTSLTYIKSPIQQKSASETEFLKELNRCKEQDLHAFAIIRGIPGTGKSHLIRWLKEKFLTENELQGDSDVILLIERANNSLRQTLMQILESGVFEGDAFEHQRRKLEGATRQLSEEGFENALLNNLHLAHGEMKLPQEKQLPLAYSKRLHYFLLDPVIREELRKEGGPIKRICRFLVGAKLSLDGDETPGFVGNDFDFSLELKRQIQHGTDGYRETRDLVDKLIKEEARQKLAAYLNELLVFAISQTTALTSDDLKRMFNELRSELRKQGRSLVLFIEDITSFTGLDTALIEILATQHTGEANRSFCRLISVLGITDYYYNRRFPDNIRERVSHHLSLNSGIRGSHESLLLDNQESIAEVAARYLNAIRASQSELENWYSIGASPKMLPNKCDSCLHKQTCHEAFGAADAGYRADGEQIKIGLYPFNSTALLNMYDQLDRASTTKTPRSLLNSVVEYVLLSHGNLISTGQFPPAANEMGNDFGSPQFAKPNQRRLLDRSDISSSQKDQIESLVRFWGDCTLDIRASNGKKTVGNLTEAAFSAFVLPFVGEQVGERPTLHPERTDTILVDPPPPPPPPQPPKTDPVIAAIESWRSGGPLEYYGDLVKSLRDFVRDSIDWEASGISISLVNQRLQRAPFAIEGQVGRNKSYHLLLKRSDSLAYALQAVHKLNQKTVNISSEEYGIHLVSLRMWLYENQSDLVAFVRNPSVDSSIEHNLPELQTSCVIALACLDGSLQPSHKAQQSFDAVVKTCTKDHVSWMYATEEAYEVRNADWSGLMKRTQVRKNVDIVRREFLQSINLNQGRSMQVRYINAPLVIDAIKVHRKRGWRSDGLDAKANGEVWSSVSEILESMKYLENVISTEYVSLKTMQKTLEEWTGRASGAELKSAIVKLLRELQEAQVYYNLGKLEVPSFYNYDAKAHQLQSMIDSTFDITMAPAISGALPLTKEFKQHVAFYQRLKDFLNNKNEDWRAQMTGDAEGVGIAQMLEKVDSQYDMITETLVEIINEGGSL